MGYPVDAAVPRITHQGRTFAVDVFNIGMGHQVALCERASNGDWLAAWTTSPAFTMDDLDAEIAMKGGFEKWWAWVLEQVNAKLRAIFGGSSASPPPPVTTPQNTVEKIKARIQAGKFTVGQDGVPVFG